MRLYRDEIYTIWHRNSSYNLLWVNRCPQNNHYVWFRNSGFINYPQTGCKNCSCGILCRFHLDTVALKSIKWSGCNLWQLDLACFFKKTKSVTTKMFNDKIGKKFQSNTRSANLIPYMVQSHENDKEKQYFCFKRPVQKKLRLWSS